MNEAPHQERSLLVRIFISPDEPRLRAGWRLIAHTILLITFGIVLLIPFSIGLLIMSYGGLVSDSEISPEIFAYIGSLPALVSTLISMFAITAATWIARRFLDKRSFASLGLHRTPHLTTDLLFGFILGGVLMALIYAFEAAMGWLTFEGWAWQTQPPATVIGGVLVALLTYIIVGYQEELQSRGYYLQNLWAGLNLPLALILSSLVFSLLHIANQGATWASIVGIFIAGFFLAYGYLRTGELWIPIGLHIGWNFFQGTVFGFPVSGTGGIHLIQQSGDGPVLITGGVFGPEAGLSGWAAIALGIAAMWLYTRGRKAAASPKEQSPAAGTAQTNESNYR